MSIFRQKSADEAPPAAAIMPVDFFHVKRGKPRGNFIVVGILTVFVLLTTLLTFVLLAYYGSTQSHTESEVKTEDLSGVGWDSCTMISKVNEEYALSANSSFTLVNVMGSKAECTASLTAASPCTSDYVQLVGYDSSPSNPNWAPLMAIDQSTGNIWASSYDDGSLFVYNPSIGTAVTPKSTSTSYLEAIDIDSTGLIVMANNDGLTYYDPSSGAETYFGLSNQPTAIAIDSSDIVWLVYPYGTDTSTYEGVISKIFKYDPTTDSETEVISLTNSTLVENTVSFISIGPSGYLWGVHRKMVDDSAVASTSIFKYETSSTETTISAVADISSDPTGFTVDSDGIVWVLYSSGMLSRYDTLSGDLVEVNTGLNVAGSSVLCDGLASDSKGALYFFNGGYLYKYNPTTETLDALQDYTSGVVSWFVCGGATESTLPLNDAQNLAACSLNGIKWQLSTPDGTFFNSAELESWVSPYVVGKCTSDIYDAVCNVVADLPPYICTKEVKASFSTYIGVAAANADFLYGALVFVCGILLDMVTAYLAKTRNGNKHNSKGEETEVVSERWVELAVSGNVQANTIDGSSSMLARDTDNAIAAALGTFATINERRFATLQKEMYLNMDNKYGSKITALEEEVSRLQCALDVTGTSL